MRGKERARDPPTNPMDMFSSLSLPPPHRLAGSTRYSRSHSLSSSTARRHTTTIRRWDASSVPQATHQESYTITSDPSDQSSDEEDDTGTDEKRSTAVPYEDVDSGAPPRPKRAKQRPVKSDSRSKKRVPPIVQCFNGKPLKTFHLFLPRCLPASIVADPPSLSQFTLTTTATYLSLWSLDSNMDIIDVRLPEDYSEHLQNNHRFLRDFVKVVFNSLSDVNSINQLYLPQINIKDTFTNLVVILKKLSRMHCTVKGVYLPVAFATEPSVLASLELSKLTKAVKAVTSVEEVTFISDSPLLPEFIATLKKTMHESTVQLSSMSSGSTSLPGPKYIAELDKVPSVGEDVGPGALIESLNTGSSSIEGKTRDRESAGIINPQNKVALHRAFTTDCSYSEESQLSTDNTYTSQVWDLERLHERGVNGSGTTIAVLDSGINYTSPAFKDRIVAVRNFVPDSIDDFDCAIDSDGHGSLCAGIAAGSSFYCPITPHDPGSPCLIIPPGVAPGAKLIVCKVVCTTSGEVDTNAFLEALKWLRDNHTSGACKIDVVSISLASSYFSQERARVISDLVSLGVIVVCCASNVGRMKMHPISYPARLGHVLCIGSHDDNGKPTSFTPVGRELDFVAPGQDIWGPGPGTKGPFGMDCGSGTSCSTPAIAGLVCLVLHDIRRKCEDEESGVSDTVIAGRPLTHYVRSVWVMRELLKVMSSSPGHHSEEIGYGTINPYRLLDSSTEEIARIVNDIIHDE